MSASQLTQPVPHSTNVMEQIQRDGVEIQRQQIELMKRMSLLPLNHQYLVGTFLSSLNGSLHLMP